MWRREDLVWAYVSEEGIASIFKVEKSASVNQLMLIILYINLPYMPQCVI
jgi:hypothetical protein